MAIRKSIDCRDYPSEKNCSLKISGTEEEVLDAAVQHAVSAHGHENSAELCKEIRLLLKDESEEASSPHLARSDFVTKRKGDRNRAGGPAKTYPNRCKGASLIMF